MILGEVFPISWVALLRLFLIFGMTLWMGYGIYRAIKTKTANGRGIEYKRKKHPILYWVIVLLQTLIFISLIAVLLHLLGIII